jgi:hypothetical protein
MPTTRCGAIFDRVEHLFGDLAIARPRFTAVFARQPARFRELRWRPIGSNVRVIRLNVLL